MTKDRLGSFLFLAAGFFALFQSIRLPLGSLEKPGPGVFPIALSVLLSAIGLVLLASEAGGTKINWGTLARRKATAGQIVALTAAYIIVFEWLGYLVSSGVYLFLLFFRVCKFQMAAAAAWTVGITVVSWFFFARILGLQLPPGPWRIF